MPRREKWVYDGQLYDKCCHEAPLVARQHFVSWRRRWTAWCDSCGVSVQAATPSDLMTRWNRKLRGECVAADTADHEGWYEAIRDGRACAIWGITVVVWRAGRVVYRTRSIMHRPRRVYEAWAKDLAKGDRVRSWVYRVRPG